MWGLNRGFEGYFEAMMMRQTAGKARARVRHCSRLLGYVAYLAPAAVSDSRLSRSDPKAKIPLTTGCFMRATSDRSDALSSRTKSSGV